METGQSSWVTALLLAGLGHGLSARYSYLMETGQFSWVTAFLLAGLGHGFLLAIPTS
jgi:hypothetical protein